MSQGDKRVYLKAGQKNLPVRAGGDFLFLKEAIRPVRVLVDGQPIVMRPGAKQRIPRKEPGKLAFNSFDVDNLSDEFDMSVTFVVGVGDYDEQIFSGDVRTEPMTLTQQGPRPDSRKTLELIVQPAKMTTTTYVNGDTILERESGAPAHDLVSDVLFSAEDGLIGYNDISGDTLYLYDYELKKVRELSGLKCQSGTVPGDYCYHPTMGYLLLGGNYIGIKNKVYTADENLTVVAEISAGTVLSFDYSEQADAFAFLDSANDQILIYSGDFSTLLATIGHSSSNSEAIRYDPIDEKFYAYGNSGALKVVDPYDYSAVDYNIAYPLDNGLRRLTVKQKTAVGFSSDDAGRLRKVAAIDYTTKPEFEVYTNQIAEPLKNQRRVQTTASISAKEGEDGITLSGETVKALLETYFLRKVKGAYLDSVYSVNPGRGPRGNYQNHTSTGARTFALEGKTDSFEVYAPAKVQITIDSELTLGAFLV